MVPLTLLLIQYKLGLVWVASFAAFAIGFRLVNTFVNARGWKLVAKHPNEIQEQNPLWRVMNHHIGFWKSQMLGMSLFLGAPIMLLWGLLGPEIALVPIASVAPLSFVIFLNDLAVVRRVEERTERYNKG